MPRIMLPTFVIDTQSPGEQLSQLGDALKTHGSRLKITRIRLHTARVERPTRAVTNHDARARNVRLYTNKGGVFHGTHHKLGNNLFISGLIGTLAMIAGDEKKTVFMMPFRPGAPSKFSNGLDGYGKALLHHAAIPLDHQVSLFIAAMESHTLASTSTLPEQTAPTIAYDESMLSLLDILKPIMGHSTPKQGPLPA